MQKITPERIYERIRYYLTVAWMYSLGLIPLIIRGLYLWHKSAEKEKISTIWDISVLSLLVGSVFLAIQVIWKHEFPLVWITSFSLCFLCAIVCVIWDRFISIHGE